MHKILKYPLALLAFLAVVAAHPAGAAPTEKRMALVIGNAAYQAGPLATPANDAGLIAQTLQAAGFDVVGARDLDEDSLRHAFRDFVDNASKAGPETVVAVYFAGYGLQLEGENYLIAFNATPGTVAPEGQDGYGPYAKALAEMIREGGLPPADVFNRVRLRVNE